MFTWRDFAANMLSKPIAHQFNICNARSVWDGIFSPKIGLFFDFNPSKWSLNDETFWSKYMSFYICFQWALFFVRVSIVMYFIFCRVSSKKYYRSRSSDFISIIQRRLSYLHILVIIPPTNRRKKKSPCCSRRSRNVLECHFKCNLWTDSIMAVKSACNSISRSSRNFTSSLKGESHEKRNCDMSTHTLCVILK